MSRAVRIQGECLALAQEVDALTSALAVTKTRPDAARIRDEAGALAARVADVRSRLDLINVGGVFTNTADGAFSALAAGAWERSTRSALVSLSLALRRLQTAADARVRAIPRGYRSHVVVSGDTFQSIARDLLGDWRLWPRIAEINGLDPAATLTAGVSLTIPSTGRDA